MYGPPNAGVECNIKYPSQTDTKPETREISLVYNSLIIYPTICQFAHSTAVTLAVQSLKTIGQLERML